MYADDGGDLPGSRRETGGADRFGHGGCCVGVDPIGLAGIRQDCDFGGRTGRRDAMTFRDLIVVIVRPDLKSSGAALQACEEQTASKNSETGSI